MTDQRGTRVQPLRETATARPGAGSLPTWSGAAVLGLLALIAILPYANTLLNGFVYDDSAQILGNPYLKSFRYLREIFGTTAWSFLGIWTVSNYYRPIMTFGYLLCYQFFGPLAYGFHLVNLALNAGAVFLLFKITERLFGNRALALGAAVVFALHPVHVEAVAWIAAVTELELAFFYLLTFWLFLLVARPGGGRSSPAHYAMVASFILTIISKEQALTLPFLATAYEHFYRDDREQTTLAQKASRYGVLWLLAIGYVVFRIKLFGAFAPFLQRPQVTWYGVFVNAIALVGEYLWKIIWPARLCAFYVFHKSTSAFEPRVLAGFGASVICATLFFWLWKRARPVSFGVLWFFATLAPVLNPRWMTASVFNERYLYLPSAGFCWAVAWGVTLLWARATAQSRRVIWQGAMATALSVIALLSLVRIVTRNRIWKDDITLFTQTLEMEPEAVLIRTYLGMTYWNRGYIGEAERQWREVLRRYPNSVLDLNYLGWVYARQKRYEEAEKYFLRALHALPTDPEAHLSLGGLYADTGREKEAEVQLRAAVALSPMNGAARNRLAQLYFDEQRFPEAEEQFHRSVEGSPSVTGYNGLGDICWRRGEREQAERAYKSAIALDPFDSHAHFGLGAVYASGGKTVEAIQEYETGLQTDPSNREALTTLEKLRTQAPHANSSKS
jgi:tetratricopeptide (TPR) repeat protein